MIIRDGFVTNSSSTNFLIISKEELTPEYLLKRLGFSNHSKINDATQTFAAEILDGIEGGLRWFDCEEVNYELILSAFGKDSAEKYKMLSSKGYHTYLGHTNSDDDFFAAFMTMDSFVIDNKDFYMDGRNSSW